MKELLDIIGIIGLFSFLSSATLSLIRVILGKKPDFWIISTTICLLVFVISTLLYPGEEEIVEELASTQKIYQRGLENEKRGLFGRAKIDYKQILRLDPNNQQAIHKLEMIERRKIAFILLEQGKRLMRKDKFAEALIKLRVSEDIAPDPDLVEGKPDLQRKIKEHIKKAEELLVAERVEKRPLFFKKIRSFIRGKSSKK